MNKPSDYAKFRGKQLSLRATQAIVSVEDIDDDEASAKLSVEINK